MVQKLTPNQVRQIELIQGFIRNVDHVKRLVGELEGNRAARPVIINNICGAIARELSQMRQRALSANVGTLADTASDPVARRWIHQLPPDAGAVLVAAPQAGSVWDIPNAPIAMHGHPSDDDAHVPIIFWGRGVKRGIYRGRANTVDIAPTLGRILGVTPLSLIDGRVLTDALAPRN